jgi:hypothetical protein
MMPLRWACALMLGACVSLSAVMTIHAQEASAPTSEQLAKQEKRWTKTVEADLVSENFDDLDRMADEYRREKTRLAGGEWRLRQFYGILDAPQLTDKDSVDHIEHLTNWMKKRPESITARVALATSLHRWAWVARGNGFANTVTPEGWQLFNKRIAESQMVLEGSANMHTMCPQWYSEMMTVGLAQSWDERRLQEVFERGVQFEPEYFYLYKQYANYLLPKWDGKPGDSADFAKRYANKLGGDQGDMLYFQIATELIRVGDGNFPVKEMNWERIQKGADFLVAKYGQNKKINNQLAFMAFKYKDAEAARRQFAVIGDEWARGVWKDRQRFDRARDWSNGHNI